MVVLVDSEGSPVGTQSKESVHGVTTPRHLAFSCHVIDTAGRLLVTRRALGKRTWPGVWTNAFCGHPGPGETFEDAVRRRAAFELGLTIDSIVCALPDFGYVARDASGIEENEHCPVFIARATSSLDPNPAEVAEIQWTSVPELSTATKAAPWAFSPWLIEHLPQLLSSFAGVAGESGNDV
ncbi:MAG TPA: isopentenyl-diphosphate Delta-isomerase [Candidatus Microbacterium pullistercoris]|nr:isopentenyl-diphosphate Delta-isomerase [Candidatus Microbacterium pullistercoris]